jgi:phage shock protein PspC (stress-responsive transcriptional regulator)
MQTFCTKCGNALPPAARFCSSCGTVVAAAPASGYPPYGMPAPPPRLLRPVHGRQFAGVCAAFARSYGWDIAVLRIITVILAVFLFPLTEVFYIAAWIAIPDEANIGVIPPGSY